MAKEPFDWATLVEAAQLTVAAAPRDKNAALEIVEQSAVAIRSLLKHGDQPDPERCVYLGALLASLERIQSGEVAMDALHLTPKGRVRDPGLFQRDLLLFVRVGQAFDDLLVRGRTRGDKPLDEAKCAVEKRTGQSRATINKVWTRFGAASGWAELRSLEFEKVE